MKRDFYSVSIYKKTESNKFLFIPYGINKDGLSQQLKKFIYIDETISDNELGLLALKARELSKNFTLDEIEIETKNYLDDYKKYKVKDFENESLLVKFVYYLEKDEYRIQKMYIIKKNHYHNSVNDPKYIINGSATPLELGKTIRLAFDDISVDGKDR